MGKGIQMARDAGNSLHADVLDDFKDQLLVVFLKELKSRGHSLQFPVSQVDDTGKDLVSMQVLTEGMPSPTFNFILSKKS
jgi:hypothetical protein